MAEDNDDSQKTEDPTAKKLAEAREQGNLPLSRDVSMWMLLLGVVMLVAYFLPMMMGQLTAPMQAVFAKAGEIEITPDNLGLVLGEMFGELVVPMLAILGFLLVMGVVGWVAQTGPFFSMQNLTRLKWERLNPIEGAKRLFSANSLFELAKGVAKIGIIGWVAYILLKPAFLNTDSLTGLDNIGLVAATHDLTARVLFAIFLVFTAIALIDLVYQRFVYFKNLKMTRTEVREEYRQTEGDPHVKQRLKQIRAEKARKRMMAAVPQADVVVTNPTHYAIALKYTPGEMPAPVVLAKGQDFIAQKIRELAEEHKIPLVSNPPLARALYATVEIDEEIPPQHYRAVAEIISYVFRLRKPKR
jgi:flagellar biosynthesis protein FlhB